MKLGGTPMWISKCKAKEKGPKFSQKLCIDSVCIAPTLGLKLVDERDNILFYKLI